MGFKNHIIRTYCYNIGIPIQRFAEQIGISKTHLFNYIDGKNNISKEVAEKIETISTGKLTAIELLALNQKRTRKNPLKLGNTN
jgi:plasmid maintenance system antidote protein VapI